MVSEPTFEGGGRATEARVAFKNADLASGPGEQGRRAEAAKT
jgi:hypothetical protein